MSLRISELLNSQLDSSETAQALDELAGDAALRDRYTVYGLIGDVLRGNSTPDDGFSIRIFQRMRDAGVEMEPGYDPLEPPK
jgi:negative regulator of sigma E activity